MTRSAKELLLLAVSLMVIANLAWKETMDLKPSTQETISKAEQGDVDAQYRLGKMYARGKGVAQDDKKAAAWLCRAAEQGHAGAQFRLGKMYYEGQGVVQDYKEAAVWFRKAAEQGDADAQYNLGGMYLTGCGVSKNYEEAASLFRGAAEQGISDAQYNLGGMYRMGLGVSQDYKEAFRWFYIADKIESASEQKKPYNEMLAKQSWRAGGAKEISMSTHELLSKISAEDAKKIEHEADDLIYKNKWQ